MPIEHIYVPIPRNLYDDIVRFSDGKLKPESIIADLLNSWISNSAASDDDHWGGRTEEVKAAYGHQPSQSDGTGIPLIWKGLNVAAGTSVKMSYGGDDHFAVVRDGKLVDADGSFTPSEWASKVANGTSRNAWRDLWLKVPGSPIWAQAEKIREANGNRLAAMINYNRSAI